MTFKTVPTDNHDSISRLARYLDQKKCGEALGTDDCKLQPRLLRPVFKEAVGKYLNYAVKDGQASDGIFRAFFGNCAKENTEFLKNMYQGHTAYLKTNACVSVFTNACGENASLSAFYEGLWLRASGKISNNNSTTTEIPQDHPY